MHFPAARPGPVADFARGLMGTAEQVAAMHDRRAKAAPGPEHHIVVQVAAATKPALGQGDGAQIVLQRHGHAKIHRQRRSHGNVAPVLNETVMQADAALGINDTRRADANAEQTARSRRRQGTHGRGELLLHLCPAGTGRQRSLQGMGDLPGKVHPHRLNTPGVKLDPGEPTGLGHRAQPAFRPAHRSLFEAVLHEQVASQQHVDVQTGGRGRQPHHIGQAATGSRTAAAHVQDDISDEAGLIGGIFSHARGRRSGRASS